MLLLLLVLLLLLLLLLPLQLLLLPLPHALVGASAEVNEGGRGCGALNGTLAASTFFVWGSHCAITAAHTTSNKTNTTSSSLGRCSRM